MVLVGLEGKDPWPLAILARNIGVDGEVPEAGEDLAVLEDLAMSLAEMEAEEHMLGAEAAFDGREPVEEAGSIGRSLNVRDSLDWSCLHKDQPE